MTVIATNVKRYLFNCRTGHEYHSQNTIRMYTPYTWISCRAGKSSWVSANDLVRRVSCCDLVLFSVPQLSWLMLYWAMLFASRGVGAEYMHIFESRLSLKRTKDSRSDRTKTLLQWWNLAWPLGADFFPVFHLIKTPSRPSKNLVSPSKHLSTPSIASISSSTCIASQITNRFVRFPYDISGAVETTPSSQ